MNEWLDRRWRPLLAVALGLHVLALFGELPEPDAALYATIARRMAQSGDFVNLLAYNVDWLDKPHFPFWVTALSFKVFGVGLLGLRLPALAFTLLGARYTFRLGLKLYGPTVARLAVLVLLTSQHLVMSNADVRAEPFLVGLLAAAVFHALSAREEKWLGHLVAASAFTAAAVMTKGPFLLFPVACAVVVPALVRREPFLLGRWLLAVGLVAVFITPELWCLWQQFDAHPEKLVFERHGVSGVRWFFWDSQFGRFANTGPIRGQGDPTFFLHTVLWSFLPWSLALYAAGFTAVKRRAAGPGLVPWSVVVPTVLLFSASRFQLPHYLNIVFPFFALLVAAWVVEMAARSWVSVMQGVVLVGTVGFTAGLLVLFDVPHRALVASLLIAGGLACLLVFGDATLRSVVGRSMGAAVLANLGLLLAYNPAALRYQVGHEAARVADALPPMTTVMVDVSSQAFAFHSAATVMWWTVEDLRRESAKAPVRALGTAGLFEQLRAEGFVVREVQRFPYFHASRPTLRFLDARTRDEVLEPWVLGEVALGAHTDPD